ncbi:RHS repeat-associated core domain-containing protein [Dissulfurirhabdus thermomarina]|nr:RHS repeat-associated core domain-containing protein [Dissulfurirhabdus thermomarina]
MFFFYGAEGLLGEYAANGSEIRGYGWWPGSAYGTIPLYLREGGAYHFIQADQLGTPRMLVDATGAVTWRAEYEAFGRAHVAPAARATCNLRFPGQYFDQETGLHYNWHRYYDPATGRYLTPDPVGLAGGINRYAYVNGNPVNWVDPEGLWAVGLVLGAAAGAVGGFNAALISGSSLQEAFWGGLAGGVAGAAVGAALPDILGIPASHAVGAMAGSIVGGSIGGATGALVVNALTGEFSIRSILQGAITGAITGSIVAPGVGLAALATEGSEIGMGIMGASGSIMAETVFAAGKAAWGPHGCSD